MAVNWALGQQQGLDPGQRFQQAFERGRETQYQNELRGFQREERERATGLRTALTGAVNPTTGEIDYGVARRAYIGAGDVQGAIGVDTARQTAATRARELQRDNIIRGARIVRQINPTDQPSWERTMAAARASGVDLTGVPTAFDPNYIQQLLGATAGASDPSEGFTLGEGDVRYDTNGNVVGQGSPRRPRYIPVAPGGRLVLDPSTAPGAGYQGSADAPQQPQTATNPQTGERLQLNPQTGQWEPVQGGASRQDSGHFPGRPVAQGPRNLASPASVPANWTSGRRTVEGNQAVGGVTNSRHLAGDAADFTPRPGQSMGQLAAELRRRFPGARVRNEGDHVHVQQSGWNVPYHGRRGTIGRRGP